MKIAKYPSVVWNKDGFQITATLSGPICEIMENGQWVRAALGKQGNALLKAYHALMQATDCEVPVKPVVKFPPPRATVETTKTTPDDDED